MIRFEQWLICNSLNEFSPLSLIGPCLHTIRNQDLIVPFEGLRMGWRDASFLMQEAVSGEAASSPFTG